MTLGDAAVLMKGELTGAGVAGRDFTGVSIDSRTTEAGQLFFAIVGKSQDGHRFASEALVRGASGLVVQKSLEAPESAPVIRVSDTTVALQELARGVRLEAPVKVVAITGSMGKTTTKEATAAALSARFSVLKSEGNLNNFYGLPLSLLRYRGEETAVVELGMSAPGEIARLTEIAVPDVGVLTNVAEVHREFFPSVEAIAEAKGELFAGLREGAVAVVNADDPLVMSQVRRFLGRKLSFGVASSADLRAEAVERTPAGTRFRARAGSDDAVVETALVGRHNVYNLLAALASARALGIPLDEASKPLRTLGPVHGRGERRRFREGFLLIDETYNSNPRALASALEALQMETGERRIAVLGDMRELGERRETLHREAGREAARSGVRMLIAVGALGRFMLEGARESGLGDEILFHRDEPEEAGRLLSDELRAGDVVLLKASRGVGLEKAIDVVRSRFTEERG